MFSRHSTSERLGISFSYIPLIRHQPFFIKELGNTIYIYTDNQPFSGTDAEFLSEKVAGTKYVTVFDKNPSDSLDDAIKSAS